MLGRQGAGDEVGGLETEWRWFAFPGPLRLIWALAPSGGRHHHSQATGHRQRLKAEPPMGPALGLGENERMPGRKGKGNQPSP